MLINVLAAGAATLPTFVVPAIVVLMIGGALLVVTRANKRSSEKSRDRYSDWAATAGMTSVPKQWPGLAEAAKYISCVSFQHPLGTLSFYSHGASFGKARIEPTTYIAWKPTNLVLSGATSIVSKPPWQHDPTDPTLQQLRQRFGREFAYHAKSEGTASLSVRFAAELPELPLTLIAVSGGWLQFHCAGEVLNADLLSGCLHFLVRLQVSSQEISVK